MALAIDLGAVFLGSTCFVLGVVYGFFTTIYAASAMKLSRPAVAASMFAVFMLFLNVGIALGQLAGGKITTELGFAGLAICLSGLLVVLGVVARPVKV